MKNLIIEKLENEIEGLLDELKNQKLGSDEYNGIVETINKLYGTLNKEKEIELNGRKIDVENIKIETEKEVQLKTLKDSKIWNGVKTVVEIGSIGAPLIFYGIWMNRGLEFEKEGTFTSKVCSGLFSKFKPTK